LIAANRTTITNMTSDEFSFLPDLHPRIRIHVWTRNDEMFRGSHNDAHHTFHTIHKE
jgi:hypothetical protein